MSVTTTTHLDTAEALVRFAEAMIDQAEQAAADAHEILGGTLGLLSIEREALWRVRLLDRLDLVLASQRERQVFARLKGVDS